MFIEPTVTIQQIPFFHTITLSLSIISSVGASVWAVLKALDKYATNHFEHMKQDIIGSGNENTKDIVRAIEDSTKDIRIAILESK